jgi:hypothetical protein
MAEMLARQLGTVIGLVLLPTRTATSASGGTLQLNDPDAEVQELFVGKYMASVQVGSEAHASMQLSNGVSARRCLRLIEGGVSKIMNTSPLGAT